MNEPEVKVNPNIRRIEIGVRELKKVKVYPLSAAYTVSLAKKVGGILMDFFGTKLKSFEEEEVNKQVANLFASIIENNLEEMIENAIDLQEIEAVTVNEVLCDMSTEQLVEICEIIYEVNYKALVSKIIGLLPKEGTTLDEMGLTMKASPTKDSLPSSADDTELIN